MGGLYNSKKNNSNTALVFALLNILTLFYKSKI